MNNEELKAKLERVLLGNVWEDKSEKVLLRPIKGSIVNTLLPHACLALLKAFNCDWSDARNRLLDKDKWQGPTLSQETWYQEFLNNKIFKLDVTALQSLGSLSGLAKDKPGNGQKFECGVDFSAEATAESARVFMMWALTKYRLLVVDELLKQTVRAIASAGLTQELPINAVVEYKKSTGERIGYACLMPNASAEAKKAITQPGNYLSNTVSDSDKSYFITAEAPGSSKLTSDYDISFYVPRNPALETMAVSDFNQRFRALKFIPGNVTSPEPKQGLEAGIVFDTNAYTSGYMPYSDKSSKLKLYLGYDQAKPSTITPETLTAFNVRFEPSRTYLHQGQLAFSIMPFCKYKKISLAHNLGNKFGESIDRLTKGTDVDPGPVKADFSSCVQAAIMYYHEAEKKLKPTVNVNNAEELRLCNEAYETELQKIAQIYKQEATLKLPRLEGFVLPKLEERGQKDVFAEFRPLVETTKNYERSQGLANYFANEAYYSSGPVKHVVQVMQSGKQGIVLGRKTMMQSLLMQLGYKLLHFQANLPNAKSGQLTYRDIAKAQFASAKYGYRVRDIVIKQAAKRDNNNNNNNNNNNSDESRIVNEIRKVLTNEYLAFLALEEYIAVDIKNNNKQTYNQAIDQIEALLKGKTPFKLGSEEGIQEYKSLWPSATNKASTELEECCLKIAADVLAVCYLNKQKTGHLFGEPS